MTFREVENVIGVDAFLSEIQMELRAELYGVDAIRRTYIPKCRDSFCTLGIRILKDKVVPMAVDLVIESLFEADFCDCSSLFVIVEATERLTGHDCQPLLVPDVEISTGTNLSEYGADCIRLYHNHATSEKSHSELKSDLGVERLPSGKFANSALILNLATLACNCLRIFGQLPCKMKELLPRKFDVACRGLRSVMQDMIHNACKIVRPLSAFNSAQLSMAQKFLKSLCNMLTFKVQQNSTGGDQVR